MGGQGCYWAWSTPNSLILATFLMISPSKRLLLCSWYFESEEKGQGPQSKPALQLLECTSQEFQLQRLELQCRDWRDLWGWKCFRRWGIQPAVSQQERHWFSSSSWHLPIRTYCVIFQTRTKPQGDYCSVRDCVCVCVFYFFYRNKYKKCVYENSRKRIVETVFMSVLDYEDVIYRNAVGHL